MEQEKLPPGTLFICATPIGNLEDITLRVLRVLRQADFIAAEDTRHTRRLLNHFEIDTPAVSYHEHNQKSSGEAIIRRLLSGETCAVVTDAGMPGISDPGEDIIRLCHERNIPVTVCPGATAVITALVLSGLPTRRYCFEGFLPQDKRACREALGQLASETRTIVLYEAPHRLTDTLALLLQAFGDRPAAVIRELTKKHETVHRGALTELLAAFQENAPKGELVLVIKGEEASVIKQAEQAQWKDMPLDEHMAIYLSQGLDQKEAMKLAAKDRGVSKRDIYKACLEKR